MRAPRIILKSITLAAAMSAVFILAGCPKHENFPTQIKLVTAPAPTGFAIQALPIDANGKYPYDLTWTVSDSTNVDHYRLYLVGPGFQPDLLHETDLDETSKKKLSILLPQSATGLQFGLSTVSTGSVESSMTVAIVPSN